MNEPIVCQKCMTEKTPDEMCGVARRGCKRCWADYMRARRPIHAPRNIYRKMLSRCYDVREKSYHRYGARGIRVCDRWRESFESFIADMGPMPSVEHTLDRIDVNGNYEPANCRWATQKQQQRNRTNNRMLTFRGETLCLHAWAERLGLPPRLIDNRLRLGWTVDEALTIPKKVA